MRRMEVGVSITDHEFRDDDEDAAAVVGGEISLQINAAPWAKLFCLMPIFGAGKYRISGDAGQEPIRRASGGGETGDARQEAIAEFCKSRSAERD